jgi:peptidoglycan/xylan/chitin deacetylase (PgdA/CDA1 family)
MDKALWACLMYHEIPGPDTDVTYLAVPAGQFAQQLDQLRAAGLAGSDLESVLTRGSAARVAITFDDGHWTHYSAAFPALISRGAAATFFIVTGRVGTPGYVTWDQLAEMKAAGMSIQSHSATHPLLSGLSDAEALRDLVTAREALDDILHQHTTTLALPGGDFPGGGLRLIANAGYRYVATSVWGPNVAPAPTLIRRYTVRRDTPPARFDACMRATSPATSPEGVRLAVLSAARRVIGADRYARWRRQIFAILRR